MTEEMMSAVSGELFGVWFLIGAKILGPRIGKFTKDKDGKVKVNAFPGHNIPIG